MRLLSATVIGSALIVGCLAQDSTEPPVVEDGENGHSSDPKPKPKPKPNNGNNDESGDNDESGCTSSSTSDFCSSNAYSGFEQCGTDGLFHMSGCTQDVEGYYHCSANDWIVSLAVCETNCDCPLNSYCMYWSPDVNLCLQDCGYRVLDDDGNSLSGEDDDDGTAGEFVCIDSLSGHVNLNYKQLLETDVHVASSNDKQTIAGDITSAMREPFLKAITEMAIENADAKTQSAFDTYKQEVLYVGGALCGLLVAVAATAFVVFKRNQTETTASAFNPDSSVNGLLQTSNVVMLERKGVGAKKPEFDL